MKKVVRKPKSAKPAKVLKEPVESAGKIRARLKPNLHLWRQYCKVRDSYKAQGYTGRQARQHAIKLFPPGCEKQTVEDPVVIQRARTRLLNACQTKTDAPKRAEVLWVHENIAVPWDQIEPKTVPSRGAISMLDWARRDPGQFYTMFAKIVLSTEDDSQHRFFDDGREALKFYERRIRDPERFDPLLQHRPEKLRTKPGVSG